MLQNTMYSDLFTTKLTMSLYLKVSHWQHCNIVKSDLDLNFTPNFWYQCLVFDPTVCCPSRPTRAPTLLSSQIAGPDTDIWLSSECVIDIYIVRSVYTDNTLGICDFNDKIVTYAIDDFLIYFFHLVTAKDDPSDFSDEYNYWESSPLLSEC